MAFYCSVIGTLRTVLFAKFNAISMGIAVLAFEAIMLYLLLSGSLYMTTDLSHATMRHLKQVRRSWKASRLTEGKYWRARLQSMRQIGVHEGEFCTLSSDAVPEFIDFYVNQVIALVLTYRN